jgi:hypothetical protein
MMALLAVLAFSAVASASASATTPEWFAKGSLLSGTQGVSATSTTPFKFRVLNLNITIECKSASLTSASITNPGLGGAVAISLKECAETSKPVCLVSKTITSGPVNSNLAYVNGAEVSDEYTPGNGTFFSLILEDCSFEGTYRITGKLCGNELSPSTEAVVKNQVFATRCAMKLGTNPAYLEGTLAFSLTGSQLGSTWTGK